MPQFLQSYLHHHWRFYLCLILGVAVYAFTGMLDPRVRVLAAGDAFFAAYLLIMAIIAYRITPSELDRKADVEDEGILLVIALSIVMIGFCCYAVILLFHHKDGMGLLALLLAMAGAPLGWFMLHLLMAFHYAYLYYSDPRGKGGHGLDFPDTPQPGAADFLYYSFVLGMTAQVSDVQVTSTRIRNTTLGHSIVAFFFNTVLIAMAVNAVVALAG
jgi:uncharacterized membrane protein